jgi:DNA-binding IclR family transcriptional regulator
MSPYRDATPPSGHRTAIVRRIYAEFEEMPGLEVTEAQAARLWWLDRALCSRLLSGLVEARYLTRTPGGRFRRATAL